MKASLFSAITALLIGFSASAQQDSAMSGATGKIGTMSATAFNAINTKGNQMVSAIKPTSAALSSADQQLLLQVAAGGQRQLAISQAVLDKVTNPQVKLLAASEVEEQTNIAAKLQEIASAKNFTLPAAGADTSAQSMSGQVQSMSGTDIDNFYLEQGGIKGHELLQQTMTTVNSTAKDETLKKLATATLPVIRTHLAVSREVKSMMGTNSSASAPAK